MTYLFDTNIVLHFLRASQVAKHVETIFRPFDPPNESWVSIISFGELRSLAKQNNWGSPRIEKLAILLDSLIPADIYAEDVFERYAEIDAFSQGKLLHLPSDFSARNMGKNDLWIAATASVLDARLLTTDADFDHLDGVFLHVEKVPS